MFGYYEEATMANPTTDEEIRDLERRVKQSQDPADIARLVALRARVEQNISWDGRRNGRPERCPRCAQRVEAEQGLLCKGPGG